MAATSKEGESDDLGIYSFKCAFCYRTMAKIPLKCNLVPKVYHKYCGNKVAKCYDREFEISSVIIDNVCDDIVPVSWSNDEFEPKTSTTNSEFSQKNMLLRIISELEIENMISIENSSLRK